MYLLLECIQTEFSQAYLVSGLPDISVRGVLFNCFYSRKIHHGSSELGRDSQKTRLEQSSSEIIEHNGFDLVFSFESPLISI